MPQRTCSSLLSILLDAILRDGSVSLGQRR